jgi:hypothetical protein
MEKSSILRLQESNSSKGMYTRNSQPDSHTNQASLGHYVLVRFGSAGLEWPVPRDLLCHESEYFRDILQDSKDKVIIIEFVGAPVFQLYLQWLFFNSYNEYPDYAAMPSYCLACTIHTLDPLTIDEVTRQSVDGIVWTVKAAVLARKLGHRLQAP